MRAADIIQKLEPWLSKHRRPAWKPIVKEGDGGATASKFGGTPWIGANDPWPNCGSCRKPLTFFLQLNLDDLPEELSRRHGAGLLQLFYCTRDECQGQGGWEPFGNDLNHVRIVQPKEPASRPPLQLKEQFPAKQIVSWNRIDDLPAPTEHDELGLKYTYEFNAGMLRLQCSELALDLTYPMNDCPAEEIAISQAGDKLAGWPAWVQGVEYPRCPKCDRQMTHIFQVDSEDNIPFMFGDVGCGHITQCPDHKDVVAFGWACS